MRQLLIWLERIITRHKALKRWKRIVTVLAAIMTFATTYALILPAITVEKNGTGEVGGMYLEQTESLDDMLEENAIEPSEEDILAGIADEDGTVETDAPTALSILKASGSDYTVNLFYDATSGIPEGAALAVSEITQDAEEYPNYLEETKKAMGLEEEETLPYFAARFFDIKIMVGDEEFTPETGVSVEISYEEPLAERANAEVSAVHFANETSEPDVIEANTTEAQNGGAATVEFAAESFSVYGVIYTVDFSWEVNGNVYECSIPGGGFISFEHLVEELGLGASAAVESEDAEMIVEDAESLEDAQIPEESNAEFEYISEATSRFTAGVASVEFSSPELVDVSKVEAETTVGQLKESRGLNIQYADDLTEEQIAKINGSTVRAGDWALISVRPFISAETLTVTMKNGEVFTVQVTDAQITTEYLSDKGNLYEVTVHYDEEAGIPADAELKVTPYAESSKEYRQVRDTVLEQAETDQMAELLALDISIVGADGQEIEPATPVRVEMVIKNLKDELKFTGDSLSILHLDRSAGDVRVETVADAGDMANIHLNKETATAAFTLDSFSQFAITYGNYVKVNVHYVDVQGNELPGRTTGVNVSVGNTLTLSNYASQIQQPDNYTYLGAHYDSLGGQTITSLEAINGPDGGLLNSNVRALLFYDGSAIVARQEYGGSLRQVDVYLVYAPSANYYILDTIDEDGCLRVQNGTEMLQTGIDQNLFVRWYRSSNNTTGYEAVTQSKMLNGVYNVPDLDGPRVNVAIDEGADQYYKAEIYTVENNEERRIAWTEPYHVPYYDDVRNGGFETPHNNGRTDESVNRWPSNWQVENGQNGVIWKTTGTANDGTKRDIEIPQGANANGQGANNLGETLRNYCFAYMPEGNQCAELNCEASGALYQDVITIPGTQMYWSLYHRARGAYDKWKLVEDKTQNRETDTMYVVAMPKDLAEKYDVTTQEKVLEILKHVHDEDSEFHDIEIVRITTTNGGNGEIKFSSETDGHIVPPTYFGNLAEGETRTVYDSGTYQYFRYGNTDWHYYTGNFSIPENQYLTRFFFVAGQTASDDATMGNFLDGITLSDSVPPPNHGQATAIIQKTVTGLSELPENYATRIEATYTTTKSNGIVSSNDKDADYDLYRTEVGADGSAVSTATWTFPIYVNAGDNVVFTKGEEMLPENTAKTDVVDGYTQTTSYVIRKQGADQTSPQEIARGSGKIIPADVIRRLTVEERSVVYIEFINHYKPKHSISVWKTDPAGKVLPTGASFELYLADDFDDTTQKPKENAEVIASGTTGENGILSLGKLAEGEYRLLETKAPAGYILPESAIKITITETQISAMLGSSNLQINVKGDEDWVEEDQADDTHQIRVWNNPGAVLPATGGCGTSQIYLLGAMLTGIAGLWLVMRQRRKQLR